MYIIRIVNSLVLWRLFFVFDFFFFDFVLHSVSPLYSPSLFDVEPRSNLNMENICEREGGG